MATTPAAPAGFSQRRKTERRGIGPSGSMVSAHGAQNGTPPTRASAGAPHTSHAGVDDIFIPLGTRYYYSGYITTYFAW